MNANYPPGTVNLDPDGVNAYGSLAAPQADAVCAVKMLDAVRLFDSQWVNIVNHDECYHDYSKEDAVAKAVRLVEEAIAKNFADGAYTQSSVSDPKWSPTPPTKDGWYWMRHADRVGCTIVEVAEGRVFENGDEWLCKPEVDSQFWHGPLQEPTE